MVAIVLLVAAVAGTLGIQEYQRWQKQLLDTETRLQETEEKLLETESELLEAQGKLEGYLLVSPLSEPIAFMSTSWGIDAIACTQMPLGYRAWGNTAATGRLLFYFTTEWDSVESIDQSDQYWLVGKDEWGARWDEEEEFESYGYYMRVDVQELHPFTWSKSKDWMNNRDSWEDRLNDYCRDTLQS